MFDIQHVYAKPFLLRIVHFRFVIPQTASKGENFRRNKEVTKSRGELSNIKHFERG
jgi:hypothetical protein